MGGYTGQLVLVLILVLTNAVFAGSEMALVSLRDSQLQRLERASRGGRILAQLARDPNRFLATIQIGITLAGFLASATAAVSLAQPLVPVLGSLGGAAEPLAVVLVTIGLAFITLVFGELAPKRIAMQRAESWAMAVARPLHFLSTISRPVVWLLGKSTNLVVRLTGNDPAMGREEVSPEEIRELVAAQRGFTAQQRTIISGAFEIADRLVREILVHRRDVVSVPGEQLSADALAVMVDSKHSRALVVGPDGLDDVIGVVHMRDLIAATGTAADHSRDCMVVPESLKVSDALRQMRDQREQFAVVVDEYGAVDGIITMEDLVEEIVGEIYDETDRDLATVESEADGAMVVPGSFPLHDLPDLGIDLEDDRGDYTTVAGLILAHLGHVPKVPGEVVHIDHISAEVVEIEGRAVSKARLRITADNSG